MPKFAEINGLSLRTETTVFSQRKLLFRQWPWVVVNIKRKLRCWFIAAGSVHHEPMVTFRVPTDLQLNWTLPDGPVTQRPQGPIGRICARWPSVCLSPVTQPVHAAITVSASVRSSDRCRTYYHCRAGYICGPVSRRTAVGNRRPPKHWFTRSCGSSGSKLGRNYVRSHKTSTSSPAPPNTARWLRPILSRTKSSATADGPRDALC